MRYCLIALLFLLTGCGREDVYQSQAYVFGTLVQISIEGEPDSKAQAMVAHVLQDFQQMHHRFHAWQPDSEVYALNQAIKNQQSIQLKPDLAAMIRQAAEFSRQTGEVFNPAIGGLINLWGFQRDEFPPISVDEQALSKLLQAHPQMSDLSIDETGLASSRNSFVKLDLGGYAKGYALDQAAAYLRSQNVKNALINIGGNIIALGKHGNKPWRVGIQHPRKPNAIATLDLPDGWAIGTSGDYQRYFTLNGKRYCHIINPQTGYPAQNTQAVTILVPPSLNAGVMSDVASKPIFIAEPKNRGKAAKQMGIENLLLIAADGKIYQTPAMAKRLQWLEHVEPSTFQ